MRLNMQDQMQKANDFKYKIRIIAKLKINKSINQITRLINMQSLAEMENEESCARVQLNYTKWRPGLYAPR